MEMNVSVPGVNGVSSACEPYRPSGSVGAAWPLGFVAGIVGAALLGTTYAILAVLNPCISLLNIFFAFGAGLLVGKCVALGIRLGHVRNRRLALTLGVVAGLFLLVFAWLGFVALLIAKQQKVHPLAVWLYLFRDPGAALSFVTGPLYQSGWFNVKGYVPTGVVLLLGWLVEAGCLMFGCVGASLVAAARPFHERVGRWYGCSTHPAWFVLPGRDPRDAGPLQPSDLERLVLGGTSDGRLELHVHFVPGQREEMLLSADSVIEVPEDADKAAQAAAGKLDPEKVKMKTKRVEVLSPHFVPASWIERLDSLFVQSLPASTDAAGVHGETVSYSPPWA